MKEKYTDFAGYESLEKKLKSDPLVKLQEHFNAELKPSPEAIEAAEKMAEQLHVWYLEATRELDSENYNPKAQKAYNDLTEQQKEIDRYIARKVQAAIDAATEKWKREIKHLHVKLMHAESRPAQDKQRTKHVTIESGHDPRLYSDTYATPLRIHIGDELVYDSESRPAQEVCYRGHPIIANGLCNQGHQRSEVQGQDMRQRDNATRQRDAAEADKMSEEWRITEAGEPPDAGWYLYLNIGEGEPLLFDSAQLGKLQAIVKAHNQKFIGADSEETCYEFTYGKKMPAEADKLRERLEDEKKRSADHAQGEKAYCEAFDSSQAKLQQAGAKAKELRQQLEEEAKVSDQLTSDKLQLLDRVEELQSKLQQAESDKRRLDWLDNHFGMWTRSSIDKAIEQGEK